MPPRLLCLGEFLWDDTPAGRFLGGAPFNVAYHLARLGVPVALGSRVGDDADGREAVARAAAAGVDVGGVQTDPALPTGRVHVALDAAGQPHYTIERPAAWDALAPAPDLAAAAATADALVFGTLAQRDGRARAAIRHLVAARGAGTCAVLDVNLREPLPDADVLRDALADADAVKLNEHELAWLGTWLGLPAAPVPAAAAALAARVGATWLCVTRGADGAGLWRDGRWTEHPGVAASVVDTVGAGDAFLAGLLAAHVDGADDATALAQACTLGAFVASAAGPTPAYDAGTVLAA